MAKLNKDIGQNISGKLGKAVFYKLRGNTYVRLAPVREKDSWTPAQENHRLRFKEVVNLWRKVKYPEVTRIWNQASEAMNGYASFMKANLPAYAMDGTLIDPHLLHLSAGKLPIPFHFQAKRAEEGSNTITVSWQNDSLLKGEKLNDELTVISRGNDQFSNSWGTGIKRSAQEGTFELPVKPLHATHMYLFFASVDKRNFSESVCFEI